MLIDAPPLLAVTDAAILSTVTDGAIVVVGVGIVKRDQLERALENLERVDGKILGLVANRLPSKGPDAYYYNYEIYRSQAPTEAPRKRSWARSRGSTQQPHAED